MNYRRQIDVLMAINVCSHLVVPNSLHVALIPYVQAYPLVVIHVKMRKEFLEDLMLVCE